ncbi:Rha family transcriptional regulator [Pseudomonas sp. LJDD11]|uniref:phage regulatory CII family protein n=1 Tax=unclassified Pseudomonas TaxID=196821 RepID=UPI002097583B|nr:MULTISPECIES: phage regulatory CII family protein [unclassified Pseudomonas]MCO8160952.1 Rha family transcriptional regulator [Pseudomonas sp. 21LCFQ010]MCQ9426704.1 Rha family transcriptional regulator [Pseudomonas sp. LJDD11]
MESFLRACHCAVLDSEPKRLAARMGLPHVNLLQRANPDNDAHRLTINHLYGILLHTNDIRPLATLADDFGYELVPRERPVPRPVIQALAHLAAESGDVTRLVFDALQDHTITRHEQAQCNRAIDEAIEALQVLRESLKAA